MERVTATATAPLRRRVLRPGSPVDVVAPGDGAPDAVHFAAVVGDGTVVGTAVVLPEPFDALPEQSGAWRLRGMATDEGSRGLGVGGQVLAAAVQYVAEAGGALVWCHARLPARHFYRRAGFTEVGEPWLDRRLGPHVRMWRDLSAE